jgi:hypothetical protein
MKGIEQLKLVIDVVVAIVANLKVTGKPLLAIIANLGAVLKIHFKDLAPEIKDITPDERAELVNYIVSKGFTGAGAEKAIANVLNEKKTTLLNFVKDIIKIR